MAAIIEGSRSRAVLLEERPSEKEIRFHERQMGSGFRVVGDPALAEGEPKQAIGAVFKTGGALTKAALDKSTGATTSVALKGADEVAISTASAIDDTAAGASLVVPASSKAMPPSQPTPQENDNDDIFI